MRLFLLLILVFIFTGCSEKIVYVDKHHYKSIPKPLLVDDVPLPSGIDTEEYIKATPDKRESILYEIIIKLSKGIYLYKVKLKNIKKYDNNASKMYR